jgi:hypothetical protein
VFKECLRRGWREVFRRLGDELSVRNGSGRAKKWASVSLCQQRAAQHSAEEHLLLDDPHAGRGAAGPQVKRRKLKLKQSLKPVSHVLVSSA